MKRFKSICAKYLEALQIVFSDKRQTWVLRLFCTRDLSTVRRYVCAKVDANLKKRSKVQICVHLSQDVGGRRPQRLSSGSMPLAVFFTSTFFGFSRVLHLSACHTQATSIAGRDLVPIIESHDGKYIAIHSDLSRKE